MTDLEQSITDLIRDMPAFQPTAWIDYATDTMTVVAEDVSWRANDLGTGIVLLLHPYEDRLVGFRIEDVSRVLAQDFSGLQRLVRLAAGTASPEVTLAQEVECWRNFAMEWWDELSMARMVIEKLRAGVPFSDSRLQTLAAYVQPPCQQGATIANLRAYHTEIVERAALLSSYVEQHGLRLVEDNDDEDETNEENNDSLNPLPGEEEFDDDPTLD